MDLVAEVQVRQIEVDYNVPSLAHTAHAIKACCCNIGKNLISLSIDRSQDWDGC